MNDPHTPPRARSAYESDDPDGEQELLVEGDERPTLPPPPEWQARIEASEAGCDDSREQEKVGWYVAFGPLGSEEVTAVLEGCPEEIAGRRCYLLNRAKGTWTQRADMDDGEPCRSEKKTVPPAPPPPPPARKSPPPLPVEVLPPPARKSPPPLPVEVPQAPVAKGEVESPHKSRPPEPNAGEDRKEVQSEGLEEGRLSNHEIGGGAFIDPASGVLRIDERKSDRVTFKASVTVSSDCNFWTGIASDISGGGLFVATYNTVPIGTRVSLDFSMPDDGPRIRAVGQVVWQRIFREDNELIPGMGVRFVHLSEQDKERIGSFVENRETLLFED